MPEARLYRTSPFSIFSSSADVRTSFRSSFRPIWTMSSAGISRGVRPMSSSPAYRSFRFTRTNKTSKTNPHLHRVVRELREVSREAGGAIWRDVADRLERSRKNWSEVNLSRLSRYAAKGEQIVVPGVVLATGEISTPLTVAAFRASGAARKKIEAAGGKAISLLELAVQNPKGSGVRIMG